MWQEPEDLPDGVHLPAAELGLESLVARNVRAVGVDAPQRDVNHLALLNGTFRNHHRSCVHVHLAHVSARVGHGHRIGGVNRNAEEHRALLERAREAVLVDVERQLERAVERHQR